MSWGLFWILFCAITCQVSGNREITHMKIAITGGTGFIGKHLARDLAQRGHEVVLIARGLYTRNKNADLPENTSFLAVNTTDTEQLTRAFAGCDAVAHCAGTSV